MKMSVSNCEILRNLDQSLYGGLETGIVETQFGEVHVRKAYTPGYCATLGDGVDFSDDYAYGATPATAFLGLAERIKANREAAIRDNVLEFAPRGREIQEAA